MYGDDKKRAGHVCTYRTRINEKKNVSDFSL